MDLEGYCGKRDRERLTDGSVAPAREPQSNEGRGEEQRGTVRRSGVTRWRRQAHDAE
jgi:hypothetical protein